MYSIVINVLTIAVVTCIVVGMSGKLQKEIKQTRPMVNAAAEAYLNLVMTERFLTDQVKKQLKTQELSVPQYNVLRILRGAGGEGLVCRDISSRMVHRVPDVTRLIDRLETRGCVERHRETGDRRAVRVTITPSGLALLAPLDEPMANIHLERFSTLSETEQEVLIDLLERLRGA